MGYYDDAIANDDPVGRWIGEAFLTWEAAISHARQLQSEGWDLFRGQTRDWTLKPSAKRGADEAKKKLTKFFKLVFSREELAPLRSDLRAAVFVAQHYVESTEYIDFTTDLNVAGVFCQYKNEKHAEAARKEKAWSCLILAKRTDVEAQMAGYETRFSLLAGNSDGKSKRQIVLPGVLAARVSGIARLSAQKSIFLATRFDDIDIDAALDFRRIYFPPSTGCGDISKSDLFPAPRTAMERVLDGHFPAPK